jgi:cytochrome P450
MIMSHSLPPTLPIARLLSSPKHNHCAMLMLYAKHGPVIRTSPFYPQYFINDPAAIEHICLRHAERFNKHHVGISRLAQMAGDSLITHSDAAWKKSKQIWSCGFKNNLLKNLQPLLHNIASDYCNEWSKHSGKIQNVLPDCLAMALRMNLSCLLGRDEPADWLKLSTLVTRAVQAGTSAWSLQIPGIAQWRFLRHAKPLHRWADNVLAEAIKHQNHPGLIGPLLHARQSGQISQQDLAGEFKTMLFAGYEATGTSFSWLLYHLSQHIDAFQKVSAEQQQAITDNTNWKASQNYTSWVIAESLRLAPPIYVFERRSKQDETICGFHIPKGSIFTISPYTIHRHPDLWHHPHQFLPERFRYHHITTHQKGCYIPFGLGPRSCIGKSLSTMMTKSLLSALVKKKCQPLDAGKQPKLGSGQITLKAKSGIHIRWANRR